MTNESDINTSNRRTANAYHNVKLVENVFDSNQKQVLISKLTDAVESIYPGLRDVTFVTIEEIKEGDWGIAGSSITAKKVAAHAKKTLEG